MKTTVISEKLSVISFLKKNILINVLIRYSLLLVTHYSLLLLRLQAPELKKPILRF